jgi:hypothetical protein
MVLRFVDVGREKKTFEAFVSDIDPPTQERQIGNAIKKSKALRSSDFEWTFDFETGEGAIFVGFGRQVGRIEVVR